MLPALAARTAQIFRLKVSADKGYASKSNAEIAASIGATPFISFASHHRGNGGGTWEKMYHYFQFRRTEFLSHYHKRSNVGSTFSMMKRKFETVYGQTLCGDGQRSLCKILCHDLSVSFTKCANSALTLYFRARRPQAYSWSGDMRFLLALLLLLGAFATAQQTAPKNSPPNRGQQHEQADDKNVPSIPAHISGPSETNIQIQAPSPEQKPSNW